MKVYPLKHTRSRSFYHPPLRGELKNTAINKKTKEEFQISGKMDKYYQISGKVYEWTDAILCSFALI